MKSLITPKWIFIAGFILVITGLSYGPTREEMSLVGSLLVAGWLAIALHELGHVIFGRLSGFEFGFFTVGPLQFEQTSNGIRLKENKRWFYVGGVAMMIPPKVKKRALFKKWGGFVAGGPILSFFAAVISFLCYEWFSNEFLLFYSIMNTGIVFATIIPMKMGMTTDGYVLLTLLRKNEEADKLMDTLLVMKELLGRKNPLDWDQEYIQLAKHQEAVIEHIHYAMLLYYFEVGCNRFEAATYAMKSFSEIPVTKKNKIQLGFLIHMKQISHFLEEDGKLEVITELQQSLSSIEPVSYYRGKAIISYLQQNHERATKYLVKVKKIINENDTLYGFYQAEKYLTTLVEAKMAHDQMEGRTLVGD